MAGEFTAMGSLAGPEGAVVGGVIDFGLSLWNNNKKDNLQKQQLQINKQQLELTEQQWLVQQQRVQEWNEKYGSIENNMLRYVQGLDATDVYNKVDGRVSRQFENARKNMDAHLASRGFDVAGGITANAFQQLAAMEADTKLKYQQLAEQQVLQTQQSVLSQNPRPQDPSISNMYNALGNQSALLGSQYKQDVTSTNNIAQSAGNLIGAYTKYDEAKNKWKQQQQQQSNITYETTSSREVL